MGTGLLPRKQTPFLCFLTLYGSEENAILATLRYVETIKNVLHQQPHVLLKEAVKIRITVCGKRRRYNFSNSPAATKENRRN